MATRDGFYLNDLATTFFGALEHNLRSGAFLRPAGQFASTYFVRRADVQQKIQFASTEALLINFPPFMNKLTGDLYLGTDTVALTIKKPDGSLLGGPPVPTYDTDVKMWVASVATGSFMAGKWMVRASTNGANADDQNVILTWGDYVDVPAAINTKLGTPVGASVSADIASIKSDTTKIGNPAGASVSADIASVKVDTTKIGTPAGVSVSADIAAVQTTANVINAKVGTPAGASVSADVAAVKGDTANILSKIGTPAGASVSDDIANINLGTAAILSAVAALPTEGEVRDAVLDALLSDHAIVGSVADGIAIASGLLQGNFMMDNTSNTDDGQTAARLRVWRSAAAMSGATVGGFGAQGAFAIFDVVTVYSGPNKVTSHKVTRSL